jgi:hypothetical protein
MNSNQYKQEFKRSNLILDRWLFILNISIDQHKSYSSGRTPIPTSISSLIEKLNEKRRRALQALQESLLKIENIECYNMTIYEQNDDLILTPLSEKGSVLIFKNEGLDPFLFEVYSLAIGDINLILVFYPENGLNTNGQPESAKKWFVLKADGDRLSHRINDSQKELQHMIKISLDVN